MKTIVPRVLILICCISLQVVVIAQRKTAGPVILITNCTLTDVINKQVMKHKNILIKAGRIVSITNTIPKLKERVTRIDGTGFVALPGFINTHTHLWQHVAKSAFPKGKLQEWVKIYRIIHCLDPGELYKVVTAACKEALLSGITTVSDYASLGFNDYGFDVNARAIRDAGIDGVLVWNNPSVFLPDSIKKMEIIKRQQHFGKSFTIWMGPGAMSFYPIPQVYSGIVLAKQLNMPVTEHIMENMQEQRSFYDTTQWYFNKYGTQLQPDDRKMLEELLHMRKPSMVDGFENTVRDAKMLLVVDSLLRATGVDELLSETEKEKLNALPAERLISQVPLYEYFDVLRNFLAIHAVWLQSTDFETGKKFNMSVSHNPESNLYLSSGIAPVYEYLQAGIPVTLGTDGAASNDGINFFSAMKAMWNMYKVRLLNTTVSGKLDEWAILQAATINGAKALQMDCVTGSLDVGKQADIVLVSTRELGMSPFEASRLIPLLIYSADTRNVKYVISNGKLVVNNGKLAGEQEAKLSADLTAIGAAGWKRVETGKLWNATYNLTKQQVPAYWYKFRSIRTPDSVHVIIRNNSGTTLQLSVVASAATFGGGQPVVAAKEVLDRFPLQQDPHSFKEPITLLNRDQVEIIKPGGGYKIQITHNGNVINKTTKAGQLLLLAEKK